MPRIGRNPYTLSGQGLYDRHDPALLDVTGARAGAGLPTGTQLQFVREATAGGGQQARITLTLPGSTTLAAGNQRLVELVATVPASAVYGRKEIIDLTVTQINGSAPLPGDVADDDALHVVGYLGDTSGSADYSTLDVTLLQRLVTHLDSGFAAWRNVDPMLVADISGDGRLNSLDASRLLQEVNFLIGASSTDVLAIPPIPKGIPPIVFGGPDPVINLPRDLGAEPNEVISVPVQLDTSAGLESVQLRLAYDADTFELVQVRRGTLTQDFDWYVSAQSPGQVSVDMSRLTAMADATGTLLVLDLRVKPNAKAGSAAIDLSYARLNDSHLTLHDLPQPGDDVTDGSVQILPRRVASGLAVSAISVTPVAAMPAAAPPVRTGFQRLSRHGARLHPRQEVDTPEPEVRAIDMRSHKDADLLSFAVQKVAPAAMASRSARAGTMANNWDIRL